MISVTHFASPGVPLDAPEWSPVGRGPSPDDQQKAASKNGGVKLPNMLDTGWTKV